MALSANNCPCGLLFLILLRQYDDAHSITIHSVKHECAFMHWQQWLCLMVRFKEGGAVSIGNATECLCWNRP